MNSAPFVNVRPDGDKTDDSEKKYTQKQFDVAVRMAAHDSAETAIGNFKKAQKDDKEDRRTLKKEIKQAEKG